MKDHQVQEGQQVSMSLFSRLMEMTPPYPMLDGLRVAFSPQALLHPNGIQFVNRVLQAGLSVDCVVLPDTPGVKTDSVPPRLSVPADQLSNPLLLTLLDQLTQHQIALPIDVTPGVRGASLQALSVGELIKQLDNPALVEKLSGLALPDKLLQYVLDSRSFSTQP